jgi:hypothetical protein
MKTLQLLFLLGFILLNISSCEQDLAEDGTKRGKVEFTGIIKKRGKEFAVFIYSRIEKIEAQEQSTSYYYYWISYTLDVKTGKTVHSTEYYIGDFSGNYLGCSNNYAFFKASNELYAIDLHVDNKTLKQSALIKLIGANNPVLKQKIATLEVDTYRNLRVLTTEGDLYLINPSTLKGELIKDCLNLQAEYVLYSNQTFYGTTQLIGNATLGFVLSDTTTLLMNSCNPTNSHKQYIYKASHPSRDNYSEMMSKFKLQKIDSNFFLEGNILSLKDSIAVVVYQTALGKKGKKKIGAYNIHNHQFNWEKLVESLYKSADNNRNFNLQWSPDGNSFFIGEVTNEYSPYSFVDTRTGKILWEF